MIRTDGEPDGATRRALLAVVAVVPVAGCGSILEGDDAGSVTTPESTVVSSGPDLGGTVEADAPRSSWRFEYDPGAGSVTVTNDGSTTYDADDTAELLVTVDGEPRQRLSPPVERGDRTTVDVDSGLRVRVVWRAPDGSEVETVAAYEVPG
jgi:hypothetical protein